jgi:single-strand selective monofunctional uracil DNA glycosylase
VVNDFHIFTVRFFIKWFVASCYFMLSDDLFSCAQELSHILNRCRFAQPVSHVYNPLDYASKPFAKYLERFGNATGRVVLLGMNPGPYGMMQVGVPFGEVAAVRDWMGIEEPVTPPQSQHPKRLIQGFNCTRSEVSGKRLWGWAAEDFGSADNFFKHFFVLNYCPLVWLEAGGKNRTPEQLPAAETAPVYAACDAHLKTVLNLLKPKAAVGVGAFAQKRLQLVMGKDSSTLIGTILHPSPASPVANRGWAPQARAQLQAMGLL